MAKIIKFNKVIDDESHVVYPQTHAKGVFVGTGETETLDTKLTALEAAIETSGLGEEEVLDLIKAAIAQVTGDNVDEAFDTIQEIATWIRGHEDFATDLLAQFANKVDKADGMGLSSNDYTDADKIIVTNIQAEVSDVDTRINNLTTSDIAPVTARQYVTANEKTKIEQSARVLVANRGETPSDATQYDLVMEVIADL